MFSLVPSVPVGGALVYSSAIAMFLPGYGACALEPMYGLISWFDLGPASTLWASLVITGPGPDLWTDFLASSWTCLVAVTLPYDVDSWLDLATSSWSRFLTQVLWLVGPLSSHGTPLSYRIAFPGGAALILLLPDTPHEIVNLTDTSCMMTRAQQNKGQPM